MTILKSARLFLTLLVYFVAVKAQRCTPGIVPGITITSSGTIQWSPALNPSNCTISGYVIDIFDSEDGNQLQFQTAASIHAYNLTFLDMCTKYSFEVHALTSEFVLGPSQRITATTPPAATLNLKLAVHNATFIANKQLGVSWTMVTPAVTRCISYYRVVYWNENNDPKDVYVPANSFNLTENIVPCMKYTFQISAIIENPDVQGPLSEISWAGFSAVPNPPKVVSIVPGNTTVNMTWKVPSYAENRCQLTALVVSGLGINTTQIAIHDSALRPNVEVHLTGLKPDNVYTSRVYLVNSAGKSRNVTVTFQTSEDYIFKYKTDVEDF